MAENVQVREYELPEAVVSPKEPVEVVTHSVSPRGGIYPVGFVFPDEVVDQLVVRDVKVGPNSQFLSRGGIPASLFAESAPRRLLNLAPARSGDYVRLSLAVTGNHDVNFRGKMLWTREFPTLPRTGIVGGVVVSVPGGGTIRTPVGSGREVLSALHVSPLCLDWFEVVRLSSEQYLDDDPVPSVPAEQLRREHLALGGDVALVPKPSDPLGSPPREYIVEVKNITTTDHYFRCAILEREPEERL